MKNLSLVINYYHENYSPDGKRDKAGRWYPTELEKQECCKNIRSPSRNFPNSYYKHCCTKKHIKNVVLNNLSENDKKALNMTREEAPLFINDNSVLLKTIAKNILLKRC